MKKKLFLSLLALLTSITFQAATWTDSNGTIWNYIDDEDGQLKIVGISGSIPSILEIPTDIAIAGIGYDITSIGSFAFRNCTFTTVKIPWCVTRICDGAFYGCTSLDSLFFEDGNKLLTIEYYNRFLGDETVEYRPPFSWSPLEYVYLGRSIEEEHVIDTYKDCSAVGDYGLFRNTSSLKTIEISANCNIEGICKYYYKPLDGCDNITSVIVHSETPYNYSNLFSNGWPARTTLHVPVNTKLAYEDVCGINTIEEYIDFADKSVKGICLANWDTNKNGLLELDEAAAVTSLDGMFRSKKIETFDELQYFTNITSVEEYAFHDCIYLKSITLPPHITSVGNRAFLGCQSLKSIVLPNEIITIDDYAFRNCRKLASINLPDCLISIGSNAFAGCSLTSITIPYGVTSIGDSAFSGCDFTSVTIPSSLTLIKRATFSGCSSLTSVTIPNSVTGIGNRAFEGCSSLTSVTIPNSVTSIGSEAFRDCSNLVSITIPKHVTYISDYTFYGCSNLNNIWCYAEDVPRTSPYDCFGSYSAALHVPAGSIEAYMTTEPWRFFSTFAPIYDEESSKSFSAGTYAKADLKRTFAEGWNTICLPFAIDDIEAAFGTGAKAYGFDDFADGELKFSHVTTFTAGTPYVIYVPAEITELIAFENIVVEESNTTSSNIDKNGAYFRGTYAPVAAGEWMKSNGTDEIYGLTADGRIRKAGAEASILGFRGYFDIPAGTEVKGFVFEDDATGIETIDHSSLTIDHPIYNVAGQRMNKAQKGINIINGKKILK